MAMALINPPPIESKPSKLERAMKFFDLAASLGSLGFKGWEVSKLPKTGIK